MPTAPAVWPRSGFVCFAAVALSGRKRVPTHSLARWARSPKNGSLGKIVPRATREYASHLPPFEKGCKIIIILNDTWSALLPGLPVKTYHLLFISFSSPQEGRRIRKVSTKRYVLTPCYISRRESLGMTESCFKSRMHLDCCKRWRKDAKPQPPLRRRLWTAMQQLRFALRKVYSERKSFSTTQSGKRRDF